MSTSVVNLAINTVELASVARVVPLNGCPESEDYNDSESEKITDLAALASGINDVLRPMFDGKVPASAATLGIQGSTLYTDTSDQTQLCFDSATSTPLVIADSLRVLNGMLATYQSQLATYGAQLIVLQAQFSATNQTDIAYTLQSITDTIAALQTNLGVQQQAITALQQAQVASGTTAVRPVCPGPGTFFFDMTLQSPVWWTGTGWVNAQGIAA
jgi:hypothetical protein